MTTWITKNLTLDLLAITIDGLNKIFDRINQDNPEHLAVDVPDPATAHPADSAPAVEAPAPQPDTTTPAPAAETTSEVDHEALLVEAQTLLRTIAQKGGVEWITGTLFPQLGTQSLTEVPAERLPEVITLATDRITQDAA